jgi:hypothetical protein
MQVRDISTNQEWQDAMHLAVPVLAVLDRQQGEVRMALGAADCACCAGVTPLHGSHADSA